MNNQMPPIVRTRKKPPIAPPMIAPTGVEAGAGVEVGLLVDEASRCVGLLGVLVFDIVRAVAVESLVVEVDRVESAVVDRWFGSSGQVPLLWQGLPTQHPWNSCGVTRHVQ